MVNTFIYLTNKKYLYIMLNKFDVLRSFAVKKKGIIAGAFVFGLLSTLCSVVIPLFIGQFYNLALHSGSTRGHIFETVFGHISDIVLFFQVFALFLSVRFVFNFFEKYFTGLSGEAFSNSIRKQLFQKQLFTSLHTFEARDTGAYLLRYSGDLKAVQDYLTKGMIQFMYDCLFIIVALGLLSVLNFNLTIVLLTVLPVLFIINFLMNKKMKSLTRVRRNLRSRNLAFVTTRLKGMLTIKIFNRESIESEKYNKRSDELYTQGKKYYLSYSFMQALYPYLLYAALLAMLWVAYLGFSKGTTGMDGSSLITFIMLVLSIIPVFRRILKVNIIWISGSVSFTKLIDLLNAPEENKEKDDEAMPLDGNFILNDVEFGYNETAVFNKLNLNIEAGTTTLIDGDRGSGKTTLFKLLTGLYSVRSGKIMLDGNNIENLSKHTLRKNIALVSDNLPLIGRSVFEVISYSRKDKKRKSALELLIAIGYCNSNNHNILDHQVADGGRNLSAGERKLLNIARALLTGKKTILMDEPFNDLDDAARNKVIAKIEQMKGKHTFIIADNHKFDLHYDNHITLQSKHA